MLPSLPFHNRRRDAPITVTRTTPSTAAALTPSRCTVRIPKWPSPCPPGEKAAATTDDGGAQLRERVLEALRILGLTLSLDAAVASRYNGTLEIVLPSLPEERLFANADDASAAPQFLRDVL